MTAIQATDRAQFASPRESAPFRVEAASSPFHFGDCWPTAAARKGAHCYPFQFADVIRIWCKTIGHSGRIEPYFSGVFLPDGTPAMLVPFGVERTNRIRILRFLDAGVSDYNAPVIFPSAASVHFERKLLWDRLKSALPPFDLAVLEKMPETVDGVANPLLSLATARHPESGHAVTLQGPWETFARNRLPRWSDSRRCLRNLQKLGSVTFEIARTEWDRRTFLDTLFRQKRRRLRETEAFDMFEDPAVGEFYHEASRHGAHCGVVLSALKLDGRVLAVNWGFVCGDRYYDLMTSNEGGEFRTFAPGRLLNEWLLEWCIEQGIRISDFGIGDEAYKFRYCDIHIPLHDAYIPATLAGSLFAKGLQVRNAAKRTLRDTRIGMVLKAARNRLYRLAPGRPALRAEERISAWVALIGSVSFSIDA